MSRSPLRVVLADDHALVRAGIRSLLERMPGVSVVGEASSGADCLDLVRREAPDLVLMDIAMDGGSGLEAAAVLRRDRPAARVLLLSMHANRAYVEEALAAGVAGYLLKDAAAVELDLALAAVMRGEIYLSPAISKVLVEGRSADRGPDALVLSPRQREVLRRMAAGESTKEIAYGLGISVKTVETHRAALMKRLAIHDLAGLVKWAIRAGLTHS